MNNKVKLAFEMLEREMEVIDRAQMSMYKGGDNGITWSPSGGWITDSLSAAFGVNVTSGIDSNDNWVIKFGDNSPIPLIFSLEEVTITPEGGLKKGDGTNIVGWGDWFGNDYDPYNPYGNGGGGGSGGGGGGYNYPTLPYSTLVFTQPIYNSAGYNSMGYNSMGYNSAGYNTMDLNSAGYNSAGYNSAGYNSAGYNSAGIMNPYIVTDIYNNSAVQNALANPFFAPNIPGTWADVEVQFSIRVDDNGQYYNSDYNIGTAYGVDGMTYQDSVANVHTHPNSDREPSAVDIISLIADATGYSPNLTTTFVITGAGTTYALVITDKVAATAFLAQNQNDLQGNSWAEGSDPAMVFQGNYDYSILQGNSVSEANEKATAAVLQGSGVSLLKMIPNPPFTSQFYDIIP